MWNELKSVMKSFYKIPDNVIPPVLLDSLGINNH